MACTWAPVCCLARCECGRQGANRPPASRRRPPRSAELPVQPRAVAVRRDGDRAGAPRSRCSPVPRGGCGRAGRCGWSRRRSGRPPRRPRGRADRARASARGRSRCGCGRARCRSSRPLMRRTVAWPSSRCRDGGDDQVAVDGPCEPAGQRDRIFRARGGVDADQDGAHGPKPRGAAPALKPRSAAGSLRGFPRSTARRACARARSGRARRA